MDSTTLSSTTTETDPVLDELTAQLAALATQSSGLRQAWTARWREINGFDELENEKGLESVVTASKPFTPNPLLAKERK